MRIHVHCHHYIHVHVRPHDVCVFNRENDIEGVIDTTFAVEHDQYGKLMLHELKSEGQEIQVTNENKDEYVK